VDDFGTGWSPLAYLKRFPVDELKVDRGLVSNLGYEGQDQTLVAVMVAMGHALGRHIVAEGVEKHARWQPCSHGLPDRAGLPVRQAATSRPGKRSCRSRAKRGSTARHRHPTVLAPANNTAKPRPADTVTGPDFPVDDRIEIDFDIVRDGPQRFPHLTTCILLSLGAVSVVVVGEHSRDGDSQALKYAFARPRAPLR